MTNCSDTRDTLVFEELIHKEYSTLEKCIKPHLLVVSCSCVCTRGANSKKKKKIRLILIKNCYNVQLRICKLLSERTILLSRGWTVLTSLDWGVFGWAVWCRRGWSSPWSPAFTSSTTCWTRPWPTPPRAASSITKCCLASAALEGSVCLHIFGFVWVDSSEGS